MSIFTQIAYLLDGVVKNVDISSNTLNVNTMRIGSNDITAAIALNLINLQNGSDFALGTNAHTHDGRYYTQSQLASILIASGASLIGIFDAGFLYTATNIEDALAEVKGQANTSTTHVGHLITLSGVSADADNLGVFTGTTITDNVTIKTALQLLETAVETKADDSAVIKKNGSVTYTAAQPMGGYKITNLGYPTTSTDASTKSYVDDNINSIGTHTPVVLATTQSLSSIYTTVNAAGGPGVGKTLTNGGVALSQNEVFTISGIYTITAALAGKYFTYYYLGNAYYVWFFVDGAGADPAPGGSGTMITASTGDLFTTAIASAVLPGIIKQIYNSQQVILTIQSFGSNQIDATAGDTGATVTVVQQAGDALVFSIDDFYPSVGSRILIKNEVNPINNGIYNLTTTGYGDIAWVLTRASDCDGSPVAKLSSGHTVLVQNGTINAHHGFTINDFNNVIVDVNPIILTQFTGLGLITCTLPLIKTNNTLSVSLAAITTCFTLLSNGSGSTIAGGKPVYVKTDGTFALANAVGIATSLSYIGITSASIDSGSSGYIAVAGESPIVAISGSPTIADRIYLDTTAGIFTNTAPVAANSTLVLVGIYIGNNKIAMQTQFMGVNN